MSAQLLRSVGVATISVGLVACYPKEYRQQSLTTLPDGFIQVQISGTVADLDAAPVSGATVKLSIGGETVTNSSGQFSLEALVVQGATLGLTASGNDCLSASVSVVAKQSTLKADLKVVRVLLLPNDGSIEAFLRPSDPPTGLSGPFEDVASATQSRYFGYSTPADSDIEITLTWERTGNADLRLWTASSDAGAVVRMARNSKGRIRVVQPTESGALLAPVHFTLEMRRVGLQLPSTVETR